MPVIKLEPTDEFPPPYSNGDDEPASFAEDFEITTTTAELLGELVPPLEVSEEDVKREAALVEEALKTKNTAVIRTPMAAAAARSFLNEYGQALAMDVAQVRMALTNKLLELANCGEPKFELKALELLGKHSDISLFTQRSEININYNNPESLEEAIKERVKRLLNADVIDVTPLGVDLDDELGVADPDENDE